ncbi:fumarylacetoacetate hydrolase family protein [Nonomuraea monospora]|uniref:Fumarylacetoacetate hydrolase family protein n=1 Tax=Nonomuraea monospora TaxID=568818 RepID=A0ABN3D553_9ACTN
MSTHGRRHPVPAETARRADPAAARGAARQQAIDDMASALTSAAAARRALDPFSDRMSDLDLATGYAVQRRLRGAAGGLAGWKLGLTSRAKQAQVGLDTPVYGFLDSTHALAPAQSLDTAALIQPRAEPEIVFLLGDDLEGPGVTADDVLAASSAVAAGLEILDSRYHDYRFTAADVVADDVSAGRYLVGPLIPPGGIDLGAVGVTFEKNGTLVATATGAAVLGHPAAAVAWLAGRLTAEGERLRAGQIVFSGGLTAATPFAPGDVVTARIGQLGTLVLAAT